MNAKKTMAFLLAVLMTLAGCSGGDPVGDDSATESVTEAETDVLDYLPDGDYGGREYVILCREGNEKQFDADADSGEVLSDSIYRRNTKVEDTYNINIIIHSEPAGWDQRDQFLNTLNASIMANDGAFDIVDGYAAYIGSALANNNFLDLNGLPYIDLTQSWWAASVIKDLSIKGKVYLAPCDITTNLWECMICMMYNQNFAADRGIDSPYGWVKDGTWTYGKLLEVIKNTSRDANGDGEYGVEDEYGLVINNDLAINNFHEAFEIPTTKPDAEGYPILALDDPKVEWLITAMKQLTGENPDCYYTQKKQNSAMGMGNELVKAMFTEDRCFISTYYLGYGAELRDMKGDFGIIPYPKYDEAQEGYHSYAYDWYTLFGIPLDVKDQDFAALITEALAKVSSEYVVPVYIDTVLKEKYARDEDTKLMINIIRDGLTFDFGVVFSAQLERAGWLTRDCVYFGTNYASTLKSKTKAYQNALDKLLENFK